MGLRDLFKRKPEAQQEATERAIEVAREQMADPTKPRATDFYLYLRTPEDADAAAEALRAEGYTIGARPSADPESERPWLVRASRELVVGDQSMEDAERFLRQLAERYDGEYDGWETAVG